MCFNCDEQFKPGHHCKALQLLLLNADIEDKDEQAEALEGLPETIKVSLKALTGATPTKHHATEKEFKKIWRHYINRL